jgi:hypothetical protein
MSVATIKCLDEMKQCASAIFFVSAEGIIAPASFLS